MLSPVFTSSFDVSMTAAAAASMLSNSLASTVSLVESMSASVLVVALARRERRNCTVGIPDDDTVDRDAATATRFQPFIADGMRKQALPSPVVSAVAVS